MKKTVESQNGSSLEENNIWLFMDDFTSETVRPIIDFILRKNLLPSSLRPKHLTLIINSPGGELPSALALIDIMKGSTIPIHTVGIGMIASCGLLTFMSGAKGHRTLTPNTGILSHQFSWGTYGKEHELIATTKQIDLLSERMISLYKECTGLPEAKIKEVLLPEKDVWLSAKEAVKYKLADKIKSTY
jgi:ATP-dependent Clp protease protease subunit